MFSPSSNYFNSLMLKASGFYGISGICLFLGTSVLDFFFLILLLGGSVFLCFPGLLVVFKPSLEPSLLILESYCYLCLGSLKISKAFDTF
jgi:hypothetical protein